MKHSPEEEPNSSFEALVFITLIGYVVTAIVVVTVLTIKLIQYYATGNTLL